MNYVLAKEQNGQEMLINMDPRKTIRKGQSGCVVNFIDRPQQDVKLDCDLDVVMAHVPIRARLLVAGGAE